MRFRRWLARKLVPLVAYADVIIDGERHEYELGVGDALIVEASSKDWEQVAGAWRKHAIQNADKVTELLAEIERLREDRGGAA